MDPWGTPALTFLHANFWPIRATLCFLSFKKSDKMSIRLPDIQFYDGLNISPLFHSLLERYRKTLRISRPSSNDWKFLSVMDNSWLMQEFLGLNPNWFGDTRIFWSKKLNLLLKICLSKFFAQIGSNETRR